MLRRRRLLCLALILGGCPEPSDASPATAEITVTDLGPVFDAGRPPRGVLWYVYLAASDAVDLPLWARVWVCGWDDGPDGEQAVLSVDSAAYERLVATGLPFAAVREEVPWKVFHAEFRARVGRAPEARGRGFVLDDSYKDPEIVADILFAYHTRYPELTALVQIGQSHQGRPIWALKVSDRPGLHEDEPPILFDAAHHASELITIEYVLDIVDTLLLGHGEDARITKWVDGAEIWCVPIVNPDGVYLFMHDERAASRKNARDLDMNGWFTALEGVDINRNYPFGWGGNHVDYPPLHPWYRGPTPASEPETRAMMGLAADEHFAAVLSFHTYGTDIYVPYMVDDIREVEPDVFRAIAEDLALAAPQQPDGRHYAVRDPPHPVDGAAHDWHTHEYGAAAYVVEGSHQNPGPEIRRLSIEGTRPVWMRILDRVVSGPWIGGRVRDSDGTPIVAEVMLKEIRTFEGESWMSRARDGRFDRAVASPGTYTLVVRADGYAAVEQTVVVAAQRTDVDIVLAAVSGPGRARVSRHSPSRARHGTARGGRTSSVTSGLRGSMSPSP